MKKKAILLALVLMLSSFAGCSTETNQTEVTTTETSSTEETSQTSQETTIQETTESEEITTVTESEVLKEYLHELDEDELSQYSSAWENMLKENYTQYDVKNDIIYGTFYVPDMLDREVTVGINYGELIPDEEVTEGSLINEYYTVGKDFEADLDYYGQIKHIVGRELTYENGNWTNSTKFNDDGTLSEDSIWLTYHEEFDAWTIYGYTPMDDAGIYCSICLLGYTTLKISDDVKIYVNYNYDITDSNGNTFEVVDENTSVPFSKFIPANGQENIIEDYLMLDQDERLKLYGYMFTWRYWSEVMDITFDSDVSYPWCSFLKVEDGVITEIYNYIGQRNPNWEFAREIFDTTESGIYNWEL